MLAAYLGREAVVKTTLSSAQESNCVSLFVQSCLIDFWQRQRLPGLRKRYDEASDGSSVFAQESLGEG